MSVELTLQYQKKLRQQCNDRLNFSELSKKSDNLVLGVVVIFEKQRTKDN